MEPVPLHVSACSASHICPFTEPLYVFTDKFALEVHTKSRLSHTIHVNYYPQSSCIFFFFYQERLPVAMGDSFKVMEQLFCG